MYFDIPQDDGGSSGSAAGGIIFLLVYAAIGVLAIAGMWKTFDKAGHPGWAAIIPFYNLWVLVKVAGKEPVWFILCLIPCVNIVAVVMICLGVAEKFAKTAGFGIGLWLLPFVFFPMLGFGDAEYQDSPRPAI